MRLVVKLFLVIFLVCESKNVEISNSSLSRRMQKRGLFYPVLLFPYNAATGILVTIAVPLALPNRNAFVSYNFESNYNMPNQPEESVPGPIIRFPGLVPENTALDGPGTPDDVIAARKIGQNQTEKQQTVTKFIENKIQLTRKGIYKMIESRLKSLGIDGKKCWLRVICEASEVSLLDSNGVLGHIIHILLTPSSSKNENFPSEYEKAEKLGRNGNCERYKNKCPFKLIEKFTKMIG